jgi:Mn2+/Fe2+ NRAMP family transporter
MESYRESSGLSTAQISAFQEHSPRKKLIKKHKFLHCLVAIKAKSFTCTNNILMMKEQNKQTFLYTRYLEIVLDLIRGMQFLDPQYILIFSTIRKWEKLYVLVLCIFMLVHSPKKIINCNFSNKPSIIGICLMIFLYSLAKIKCILTFGLFITYFKLLHLFLL